MPKVKHTKNPESVRFTMSGVVEKYPAMYGTAGVYMSSDSGVMNDDTARSAMRPPVRRRLCGTTSHSPT